MEAREVLMGVFGTCLENSMCQLTSVHAATDLEANRARRPFECQVSSPGIRACPRTSQALIFATYPFIRWVSRTY